jgi:TorA maturation chaperone TorD
MTAGDRHLQAAACAVLDLGARTFGLEVDLPFYRALLDLADTPIFASRGLAPLTAHERAMPPGDLLNDLASEYCRLFIGPRAVCPPYASAQSDAAALGGHRVRHLQMLLKRYGLRPVPPAEAPVAADDNIAVGLALLAYLLAISAGDRRGPMSGIEAAAATRELRSNYLLGWAPTFLRRVQAQAQAGPYAPVARVTELVLVNDGLF